MNGFTEVEGVTAPIELSNIDTDMIIPKQFLKTIKRSGLGEGLFYEMRYDEKGNLNKDFILNEKPFLDSKILIAFENFGCGSSREHAPWALKDFGISVILAISFADIFFNNCFKNGILPIKLNKREIDFIISNLPEYKNILKVNLMSQQIAIGKTDITFDIDNHRKESLLNGWDDIDLTLKHEEKISSYEISNPNSYWIDIER
jgi:3-isopropylmalate/(R)-2-methylmalate dehydratase small subunit